MSIVWATVFALVYELITHYRPGTIAIWIGVVSHWVLDWITHHPDMPLYPGGGPKLGLGLWNSVPGTMMVELSMFAVGILFYMQATRARDRIGRYAFAVFVVLLLVFYIGDRFSPPPASVSEIAWPGVALTAIFIPWAWWFDRHREIRDTTSRS
jgi:hypothetical protein